MAADAEKGERKTIQISGTAHTALEAACKKRPVERSMFSAASRLIEWFVRQPPHVKSAVMSDVDAGMELQYAEALEILAAELRAKVRNAVDIRTTGRDPRPGGKNRVGTVKGGKYSEHEVG